MACIPPAAITYLRPCVAHACARMAGPHSAHKPSSLPQIGTSPPNSAFYCLPPSLLFIHVLAPAVSFLQVGISLILFSASHRLPRSRLFAHTLLRHPLLSLPQVGISLILSFMVVWDLPGIQRGVEVRLQLPLLAGRAGWVGGSASRRPKAAGCPLGQSQYAAFCMDCSLLHSTLCCAVAAHQPGDLTCACTSIPKLLLPATSVPVPLCSRCAPAGWPPFTTRWPPRSRCSPPCSARRCRRRWGAAKQRPRGVAAFPSAPRGRAGCRVLP